MNTTHSMIKGALTLFLLPVALCMWLLGVILTILGYPFVVLKAMWMLSGEFAKKILEWFSVYEESEPNEL